MIGTMMTTSLFALATLLLAVVPAQAEFRRFDGDIQAASNYIHYSEGYVVAPGYVDISNLVFVASTDVDGTKELGQSSIDGGGSLVDNGYTQNEVLDWDDDDTGNLEAGTTDDHNVDDGGGGGGRWLVDNVETGATFVDIVIFHEPPSCANTYLGCDWSDLGVGGNDGVGNLRWCCSGDAITLSLCTGGPKQEGRLIINHQFQGEHVVLPVPALGKWEKRVTSGYFDLKKTGDQGTGKYIMLVANCNEKKGRNLTVSGQYVWKSVHGYLPGNLFGEMHFFSLLVILYVILIAWYGLKMSIHGDAIILIQKCILATIGIGLLEAFFKAGDLWVWNVDGDRFWFTLYTGVIVGVLKRAISRVLVVMLCLGLGVTCDSLGGKMKKVVMLGIAYACASVARDVMTVLAITENEVLSTTAETELLDVVVLLSFITAFIDVCFYLWIFGALNETMKYLEDLNQSLKLRRYLRLRMILLLSALFALVWTVFGIVDSYNDQRIINEEVNGWVLTAVWELSYLFALVGISCLWAPEAGAKEYAYMQELTGNDLELTNVDGPDSDDEFVSNEYDFDVNRGVNT